VIWRKIIRYARRQVRRAGWRVGLEERNAARRVAAAAKERPDDDAERRFKRTWGALHRDASGGKMEFMREGPDAAEGAKVHVSGERFESLSKEIGDATVKKLDRGFVVAAAQAWQKLFVGGFEPLTAPDGGEWLLETEVTFELFVTTLYAMPRGKAVGQSGFSVELARSFERSGEVQLELFRAIMADLRAGDVAPSWRVVVFALLVKPPPNNPELVAERRDIAILDQLMKTVLQMVRTVSYSRVQGRVLSPQLGWLQGHSTAHVGLQLEALLQQAARLGHEIWVLYVDLATFFPSMPRYILWILEVAQGIPEEALELAMKIFGMPVELLDLAASLADQAVAELTGVECRYDASVGLGGAFLCYIGALQGCVLSTNKARIFMNSLVAAVWMSVRGVRLWGTRIPSTHSEAWSRLTVRPRGRLGRGADRAAWRRSAGGAAQRVGDLLGMGACDRTEARRQEAVEDRRLGRVLFGAGRAAAGGSRPVATATWRSWVRAVPALLGSLQAPGRVATPRWSWPRCGIAVAR